MSNVGKNPPPQSTGTCTHTHTHTHKAQRLDFEVSFSCQTLNSLLPTHISTQITLQHMAFCITTNVTTSAFILLTKNHITTRQFPPIRRNNKEHIMYL